jgi:hypothetical protein
MARCLNCDSQFVIPQENDQIGQLIAPEAETALAGFYHAVLVDSWKVFIQKESLIGLLLCIALTCFHFFIGDTDYSFTLGRFRPPLVIGWIATIISAGILLWYFMEIINNAAMDNDFLPSIYMGGGFAFFGELFKSIYLFAVAFVIAVIPAAVISAGLEMIGLSYKWLNLGIFLASLTLTPMMLSMLGCALAPWKLFRYDIVVRMIVKTWGPYLLTTLIFWIAMGAVFLTLGFFSTNVEMTRSKAILMLSGRIAAVLMMIFTMQAIGLYARHYYRCFPELGSNIQ